MKIRGCRYFFVLLVLSFFLSSCPFFSPLTIFISYLCLFFLPQHSIEQHLRRRSQDAGRCFGQQHHLNYFEVREKGNFEMFIGKSGKKFYSPLSLSFSLFSLRVHPLKWWHGWGDPCFSLISFVLSSSCFLIIPPPPSPLMMFAWTFLPKP